MQVSVKHIVEHLFELELGKTMWNTKGRWHLQAPQNTQKQYMKRNKTAELSQRRPRDAPNIWVHW